MYNPLIYSFIISTIILICYEIFYRVKYDETDKVDEDKVKYQMMIFISSFTLLYIYKVSTHIKSDIPEITKIESDVKNIVSDAIDNIEYTKAPF